MSRAISTAALTAMFAQDTGEAYLVLITISHPDLPQTLRVTSDRVNTVSRGMTFVAYPFEIKLPSDESNAPPKASITIDNIARDISDALRAIKNPANFNIEVVRSPAPDVVEASYVDFLLTNVKGDVFQISGELSIEDTTTAPYPYKTFSPAKFPGLV